MCGHFYLFAVGGGFQPIEDTRAAKGRGSWKQKIA
jgi:hypothetical protein